MKKVQKTVTVLNVYRFRNVARICFEILSSDEITKYNTCFNGDVQHGACGCDRFVKGHKECYHIEQLRPRAQEYFQGRNPAQPKLHNANERAFEVAPSGRMVPMA